MSSHSTVCGIRDVIESEMVVELTSDDIEGLLPDAGAARGDQEHQGDESNTHLIERSGRRGGEGIFLN